MMPESLLPFQYASEKNISGLTAFAGLPLYMEMAYATGLNQVLKEKLNSKEQGWSDGEIILSLILLNIAGGDCVDDMEKLARDEGLSKLLVKLHTQEMSGNEARVFTRRWRKSKTRSFPSGSAIRRYLEKFHSKEELECQRQEGVAYIPANQPLLDQLIELHSVLVKFAQSHNPLATATLDQDATLCVTHKKSALYCYKKYKAYQPFNTYWHEQGLILHSEFRDGNVPAGFEQLRLLKAALVRLPAGVKQVLLRSDAAGYQENLLTYCAEGNNERFGVIEFAIACKVSAAFQEAVREVPESSWKWVIKDLDGLRIQTEQQWAELNFVPSWAAKSKKQVVYRYLAIREPMKEADSSSVTDSEEASLPFQTIELNQVSYKLFGMVTNRTLEGNALIEWHRKRCGDSEKIHSVEKNDLAGGQFPSGKFGANAAWWHIMTLAFNLNALFRRFTLPASLKKKRLKALRFHIIQVPGRVIEHARKLWMKLGENPKTQQLLISIREAIWALVKSPPQLAQV
jgi:hypothetical protein